MEKYTSGIYKIENQINGKVYIGCSKNLEDRLRQHKRRLKKGIHQNPHLQNSWDKYGGDCFLFEVLLECPNDLLEFFEQRALDKYESYDRNEGYNIVKRADHKKFTEEHKRNIGEASRGRTHTEEQKRKWSEKRQNMSEETRKKMSDSTKEWHKNNEHPMKGKTYTHSEEAKKTISEKLSGRNVGNNPKKGVENVNAKFNEKQVKTIKLLLRTTDLTQKEIGKRFDTTQQMISDIKNGRRYENVELNPKK